MAQIPHRPQPCSLPFSVPVHHKQLRDGTTAVRLVLNPSLDWPGVPKRDFVRDNKSLPREASAKRKRMQAVVRANQHTEQHRPGFIPKSSRRLPEAAPELDCPSRVGPHRHDRVPGELPKYLRDRKTAWAAQQAYDDSHAQDPRAPPGYRLISEQERAARLAHLLDIYHACMASLRKMSVASDTLKFRRRREALECKLAALEHEITRFSQVQASWSTVLQAARFGDGVHPNVFLTTCSAQRRLAGFNLPSGCERPFSSTLRCLS
eukprot:m.193543 g.193543  ORF g.193543 m.193543 type:complete len:264 (+) comp18295_c0_seq3:25-816(+)